MFGRSEKKAGAARKQKAVELVFYTAIAAGDALHALEIAQKFSIQLTSERLAELLGTIRTSSRSNPEKAQQLLPLIDLYYWRGGKNTVAADNLAGMILELDPSMKCQVAQQRIGHELRLKLVEELLEEGKETAADLRKAIGFSLWPIWDRDPRAETLLRNLMYYALARSDIETACDAAVGLLHPLDVPKDTWKRIIQKVLGTPELNDNKRLELAIQVAQKGLEVFIF